MRYAIYNGDILELREDSTTTLPPNAKAITQEFVDIISSMNPPAPQEIRQLFDNLP